MTSPSAASEGSASGRDSKAWLASCSAFAVALLLLGAMLWTLFEKNLVSTMTEQGWSRQLYGISAALTKLRFGIGGAAVDQRLLATLMRSGLTSQPEVSPGVRYPDNLRDAKLLQFVLVQALTIDLPPSAPANAKGDYVDLIGFSGEDTGLGTYNYLAFRVFGVNIPALTYLYFVIVTASLVLYGIGHWRSVGAMAAVVAVVLALYAVACADFVNFLGSSAFFDGAGIDLKDPQIPRHPRGHSSSAPDCHVDAAALPARSARLCCRRPTGGDFRFCPANPLTGRLGGAGIVGLLVDDWSAGIAARSFAAVAL